MLGRVLVGASVLVLLLVSVLTVRAGIVELRLGADRVSLETRRDEIARYRVGLVDAVERARQFRAVLERAEACGLRLEVPGLPKLCFGENGTALPERRSEVAR